MTETGRVSKARERILLTADRLFYDEGIHAVGIQRIVAEASVTRVTLYRHFPSKDDLVAAYLERRAAYDRDQIDGIMATYADDPRGGLEVMATALTRDDFGAVRRGCPFINASAEYPDPESPVRIAIRAHRSWFHRTLAEALSAASRPDPDSGARALVLLRDAALVGGYLDGPDAMRETFVSASRALAGLS